MTKELPENLSFEDAMRELEGIVSSLESGQTNLEDSVKSYERGMQLRQFCEQKLKDATLKIEKVTGLSESGTPVTENLDPDTLETL